MNEKIAILPLAKPVTDLLPKWFVFTRDLESLVFTRNEVKYFLLNVHIQTF